MDATCSDVREILAPMSFNMVHGGCASVLNVDKALIGQLSPLGKAVAGDWSLREGQHRECRRAVGTMTGAPE